MFFLYKKMQKSEVVDFCPRMFLTKGSVFPKHRHLFCFRPAFLSRGTVGQWAQWLNDLIFVELDDGQWSSSFGYRFNQALGIISWPIYSTVTGKLIPRSGKDFIDKMCCYWTKSCYRHHKILFPTNFTSLLNTRKWFSQLWSYTVVIILILYKIVYFINYFQLLSCHHFCQRLGYILGNRRNNNLVEEAELK